MMMMGGPGGPAGATGGGGGASSLSDADRTKMREAMQKALNGKSMQDLTPEERQKVMEEVRKAVPALAAMGGGGGRMGGGGRSGAGGPSGSAAAPADGTPGAPPADAAAGGEGRGGGRRGGGGGPGGPGGMAMAGGGMGMGMARPGAFSEKDFADAKLPPAVEASNQLDVLLRPGLLADVEIIVEKIPNALNIPAQAVFEKDGKQIVYVKTGKGFEERPIKVLKRTESTMVLESGVQANETIAMSDPNVKPGAKKEKGGGGPMGGLPGGGK